MEIINHTLIVTFSAVGVLSGFFLIFLAYAYYKIYRADKVTRELDRNRWHSYMQGRLNFNRR